MPTSAQNPVSLALSYTVRICRQEKAEQVAVVTDRLAPLPLHVAGQDQAGAVLPLTGADVLGHVRTD
jgi:hypothetical protein